MVLISLLSGDMSASFLMGVVGSCMICLVGLPPGPGWAATTTTDLTGDELAVVREEGLLGASPRIIVY